MRTFVSKQLSQQVDKRENANTPTTVEEEYTIPQGKEVRIDRFFGGREDGESEVRCELVTRSGSSDTILAVGYALNFDIRDVGRVLGDGTKKIVLRLINGDNGEMHMTAMWRGIYDG